MVKNYLSALLLFLIPLGAFAQNFEVDGIYYSATMTNTCSVVPSPSSSPYTGAVDIPSSVEYDGTTYSVTGINNQAFYNCTGLTSVTIPNSVTSIGYQAFANCSGLTSLTIPNSVTSISIYTFQNCYSLTSVTIGNSVTSIGNYAFHNCYRLTSVTIPNSVTSIGPYAFQYCRDLTSVTIGNSVTSIGSSAFYSSGITSVTIPNSVTSIGDEAFYGCASLKSLTIGNSVKSIGISAFHHCKDLTSVVIPNSVESIGEGVFRYCYGLTSVTIGNSVKSIGDLAFEDCSDLTELKCLAEVPPTCTSNTFSNFDIEGCKLIVPEGSLDAYQTGEQWMNFSQISGAKVYDVAIDNIGYVTRCFADNVDLSGTGLTAYVVSTYDDASAMLTEVTGVVPADAGVILYAANEGTYSLTSTSDAATDANLEGNKLMGVLTDTELEPGAAYVLAADGADGVEFALLSDDANSDGGNFIPANRAYLPVNATGFAAPQTLSFTFGTPTAIERVTVTADDAEVMWYTLGGVPVKNPSKGIFVNNKGKVVLFK